MAVSEKGTSHVAAVEVSWNGELIGRLVKAGA